MELAFAGLATLVFVAKMVLAGYALVVGAHFGLKLVTPKK